jgi:hypothetical protein
MYHGSREVEEISIVFQPYALFAKGVLLIYDNR